MQASPPRVRTTFVTSARAALPILVLALVWGCNWPVLKMGVSEMAPLTFRALTLPFAAIGMLAVARLSGDSIRIPRELWLRLGVLALFNIAGWNGFVLFGVQQLPAGRSAILAYTMPIWATVIAALVLHEPISRRKLLGLVLGAAGMAVLIGEEIAVVARSAVRRAHDPRRGDPLGVSARCCCASGSRRCRRTRCRAG